MQRIFVITGTDTGVGKTVLTCLLAACLHSRRVRVAALKPICSGGRSDARALRRAAGNTLPLDVVNPWHFRAPLAPLLAARMDGRKLQANDILNHIRRVAKTDPRPDVVLVESAGGLLSPLGEGFDTRDLLKGLRAVPIVVAANRLGAVNHLRLTLEAMPPAFAAKARIVLMNPPRPDRASRTNAALLADFAGVQRIATIPHLPESSWLAGDLSAPLRRRLAAIVAG